MCVWSTQAHALCYHLIDPVGQVHASRYPPYDIGYPRALPISLAQQTYLDGLGYLIISQSNTNCSAKRLNLKKIAKQIADIRAAEQR